MPNFLIMRVIFGYFSSLLANLDKEARSKKKKKISTKKLAKVATKIAIKNIFQLSHALPAEIDNSEFSITAPPTAKIMYFLAINHVKK